MRKLFRRTWFCEWALLLALACLATTASAITLQKKTHFEKRDNDYKFNYKFLDSKLNVLQEVHDQCYAFSLPVDWAYSRTPNYDAFLFHQVSYVQNRPNCQLSPSTCNAGIYIPNGIQTYGGDIYFQTSNLPTDSTVCVGWTGWGCARITGITDGQPGSGGSGYICEGSSPSTGKACFFVPQSHSIAIKLPWGQYSSGTAALGDTIAIYSGDRSLQSVCNEAFSPSLSVFVTGIVFVTSVRNALPVPLSPGNVLTDPNCNGKFQALYGETGLVQVGPQIYLQLQVPVFGSTRTPGNELLYRDPLGTVYNGAMIFGLPITLNLAQVNPTIDTYAKCVCGTETTLQKITPPNRLLVNDNVCTCTFYNTPPSVTFTTTVTTTKPGGSVETDSGIVIVEQDSNGSLSTSTSFYPRTGIVGTTTVTTTKPGGSVETDSGIVIVEEDSKGSLSTSISLFPHAGTVGTTVSSSTKSGGLVDTDVGTSSSAKPSALTPPFTPSFSSSMSNPGGWNSSDSQSFAVPSASMSAKPSVSVSTGSESVLSTPTSSSDSESVAVPSTSSSVKPSVSVSTGSESVLSTPTSSSDSESVAVPSTSSSVKPSVSVSTGSENVLSSPTSSSESGSAAPSVVTTTRTVVTTRTNTSGLTEVETTTITTTYCPLSSKVPPVSVSPIKSSSNVVTTTRTVVTTRTNSSGLTEVETTTLTTTYCPLSSLTKESVVDSNIPATDISHIGSKSGAVPSAILKLSTVPSAASSSSSSSVPVYEGLGRATSPMTVMIFIPILALAL